VGRRQPIPRRTDWGVNGYLLWDTTELWHKGIGWHGEWVNEYRQKKSSVQAKNPIKGGMPAKENKVVVKLKANILFIWK